METSSALLAICAGNSSHKGQWRGALTFSLICTRINEQWWGWWFETPSSPLRRHCNETMAYDQRKHIQQNWMVNGSWWRQMETLSASLAFCAGNSPVTSEFPSQRPVTRSFDVSLICAWTDDWVNNRNASDLRRHRAHYGVTVMI